MIEWADYLQSGGEKSLLDYLDDRDHVNINLEYEKKNEGARKVRIEGIGPESSKLVEALFNSAKDMLSYS